MNSIQIVRSISKWIFIIPFISVNICLLIITQFHEILVPGVPIDPTFPYIDGGVSISRTVRNYPMYLIFKPSMFLTSFLLIIYWINTRKILFHFDRDNGDLKIIFFFGVCSAIFLTIHSIFLGIKFDNDLYKFLRRVVMLGFIIFEIIAQAYTIKNLLKIKEKITPHINEKYLFFKKKLITVIIISSIIILPFLPFNNLKYLKHALEWNVFLGVIIFYFLTFLMWKKN